MSKLSVFNFITLNGFFKGPEGDLSWHDHGGEEENRFSDENATSGSTLIFGRVTYEMMAGFWPTPMAAEHYPTTANGMNSAPKIVFSNTLKEAAWNNTTILSGDIVAQMKKLKEQPGPGMTILGSGSITSIFADHGLIDEYQLMLDPLAIGAGTPIFSGITGKLALKLTNVKQFKTGRLLLSYKAK